MLYSGNNSPEARKAYRVARRAEQAMLARGREFGYGSPQYAEAKARLAEAYEAENTARAIARAEA